MTVVQEAIAFLERTADELDQANEGTRRGGWSTHQIQMNERLANDCRRLAARLKAGHR